MVEIKPDVTLNLRGMSCPMPVVKAKKAVDGLKPGQILLVEATDKGAKADIPAMLSRTGNELLEAKEANGVFTFLIKKS